MAIQAGAFPFTGSIGNVTGYKRNGKYYLKEKNVITRERVFTDDRFVRTLENAEEFRRTVRAGKLVRCCLARLTKGMKLADNRISARLNGLLSKVVKSDPVSDRGQRMVCKGRVEWLNNFVFQKGKAFNNVFMEVAQGTIDMRTGRMKVEICPFDPKQGITAPEGATHFNIVTCAAAIDFENERHHWEYKEAGYLSLGEYIAEPICLVHAPEVKEDHCLLLAMGVVFYKQTEDGNFQRVKGGVMRILQVASPSLLRERDKLSGVGELVSSEVVDESFIKAGAEAGADANFIQAFAAEEPTIESTRCSFVLTTARLAVSCERSGFP